MPKNLDIALSLAQRGFRLFPQDRNKRPLLKGWPEEASSDPERIRDWARQHPTGNFAVATGKRSGILVLDVDVKGGQDGLKELEELELFVNFEPTYTVRTPSGGLHRYFRYPATAEKVLSRPLQGHPGLEIKADGGCITLPGSFYKDGREYVLVEDRELAECPAALLSLIQASAPEAGPAPLPHDLETIPRGERNVYLTRRAGELRRKGWKRQEILAALASLNQERCDPPLPEEELRGIAGSISSYDPASPLILEERTDIGNARRFIAFCGGRVRYVALWGKWVIWDGKRWALDDSREILDLATKMIDTMYDIGRKIKDRKAQADFMSFVAGISRVSKIRALLEMASADRRIAAAPEDFDRDPYLLNLENGIYDLRMGTLEPHDPEKQITKLAPVVYEPEADCPAWRAFLGRVLSGDAHLAVLLQQAVGYSLSGDTSEQVLFFLHGPGANGKSTLIETIAEILGDYAAQTPIDTLLIRRQESIPNDIARLKGARFVYAEEAEQGRRLAESMVKQLTGGDTITARYLHQEYFEFRPELKLWVGTNHRPVIAGQDHAIWRRIRLLPFLEIIPPEEQDKQLKEKLLAEAPGILRWATLGYSDWIRNGLLCPERVQKATDEYRSDMDIMADFIRQECVVEAGARVGSGDLFRAYKGWAEENGEHSISQRTLAFRLQDRGFERYHGMTGTIWVGVRLRNGNDAAELSFSDFGGCSEGLNDT